MHFRSVLMRLLFCCALLRMAGSVAFALSESTTLAALRDHARPLLIFSPSAGDPRLLEQLKILRAQAGDAAERDLVAIAIPEGGDAPSEDKFSEAEANRARRRFHIGAGEFLVVLVGKDGGEKLRSPKPIPFEKLRSVIDSMPMRREEMKGKAK